MIKLGIDIVDLEDPQLKKRDERALRLILHPEDTQIQHPAIYWLLWTAKEAVFKCLREESYFSPTQIPIELVLDDDIITFSSKGFDGKIEVTDQYILAICSDRMDAVNFEAVRCKKICDSTNVRAYITNYFERRKASIRLGKDTLGLPILLPGSVPISLSHHGHWSAFVYPSGS